MKPLPFEQTALRQTTDIRELIASLKKLIVLVEMYCQEAGGCDHTVGICMCGENRDLEEAKELLEKLQ